MHQLSLIDLGSFTSQGSIRYTPDPTWDNFTEFVLDNEGLVNPDGQTTLFYDDSGEPPDPDDYDKLTDYYNAWRDWEQRFPEDALQIRRDRKYSPGDKVRLMDKNCITYGSIAVVEQADPGRPVVVNCWRRKAFYPSCLEPYSDKYSPWDTTIQSSHFTDYSINSDRTFTTYEHQLSVDSDRTFTTYEHTTLSADTSGWIERYYVLRSSKKHYYYRYAYPNSGKTSHLHIGPMGNDRAIALVQDVSNMILHRSSIQQILDYLRTAKS